jgi:hypothetical protein
MSHCCQSYDYFQQVRDLVALFHAYSGSWSPAFYSAVCRGRALDDYAAHLLIQAEIVAEGFPDVDLWDRYLPETLKTTMKGFDPSEGSFDLLFVRNLRRRLRRDFARAAGKAQRAARGASQAAVDAGLEVDAFKEWAVRFTNQAIKRLDAQTRTYLSYHLAKEPVADIAIAMGLKESYLRNRYGGKKLDNLLKRAVRETVEDVPNDHLRLLVRHLHDAGVRQDRMELLLMMPVRVDLTAPLMDEDPLLDLLGWRDGNISGLGTDSQANLGVGREYREVDS